MYKIIGADHKEYGPVTSDALRQWITDGRVNAQTLVQAAGTDEWRPIGQLADWAALFPATVPAFPGPVSPGSARTAVDVLRGPAIGMIIVAGLNVLGGISALRQAASGKMIIPPPFNQNPEMVQLAEQIGPMINFGTGIVVLVTAVLMLLGGLAMLKVRQRGLCLAAAIIALIPCLTFVCLGIPVGIWALVALARPEVKQAFGRP